MRWEQQVQYASISDIGFRRRNNQDAAAVNICRDQATWQTAGHFFMVADGMGGHAVGELASKIAVDTLPHTYYKSKSGDLPATLKRAIELTNSAIHERSSHNREFERMGTTCTALALSPRGAIIGHVGDSRVYRIRHERIDQLTFDHSLQWELLRQGRMRPEDIYMYEPRHVITRSLGPEESVEVDIEGPYAVLPGDIYVLCSDGLTGHVKDEEIGAVAAELPPGPACRMLVNLANLRGGSDNITVVITRVGELPAGLVAEDPRGPPARTGGPRLWLLVLFWAIAIVFVAGVSLVLLGWLLQGVSLVALTVIAVGGLVLRWLEKRQDVPPDNVSTSETTVWRPYRTASARLTRRFMNHLASVEAELHRAAADEGWAIDWAQHEQAFRGARNLLAEKKYARGFLELARAIDILVAGLQQQRRQINQEQKRAHQAEHIAQETPQPQHEADE